MSLGFVNIQNLTHLGSKRCIYFFQSLGDILMYGGFTYSELFCGLPDSGVIVYNILGGAYYTFDDIIFQIKSH